MSKWKSHLMNSTSFTPAPELTGFARRVAAYEDGFASCLRVIRTQTAAAAEMKLRVFRNQACEIATYVRAGGIDKIEAVDGLAGAADEIGLDVDAAQAVIAEAFAVPTSDNTRADLRPQPDQEVDGPIGLAGWRQNIVSAHDLRTKQFDPISYIVPGYIPEGVTVFAGKPKIGKSWLLFDVCLASAAGRFVLGTVKPAEGEVLYLALEDSQRRLKRRLNKLWPDGAWPERLTLATDWRRADAGGIDDIAEWCESAANPVLVVIDTLEKFRPLPKSQSIAYSADYQAIAGLHRLSHKRGLAIVVIHHLRKMEADDPFDMVSGTHGLTGAADTILVLKRKAGNVTLHARGRDIDEKETACQFDKRSCRWTILGDANEIHNSGERAAIRAAIQSAGEGGMHIAEIMAATERTDRNSVDQLLFKMQRDGELIRIKRGVYAIGKIGKKERNEHQVSEMENENGDLTNLTDLTGASSAVEDEQDRVSGL